MFSIKLLTLCQVMVRSKLQICADDKYDVAQLRYLILERVDYLEKRKKKYCYFSIKAFKGPHTSNDAPPGWLSGERVGLMTWWL